jgi:hypothetical protein
VHAEAIAQLALATLQLRFVPADRSARLLGRVERSERPVTPAQWDRAKAIGMVVAADAARLPWHPTCLRQALAVQRMLRRRGIPSRLHLGVTSATEGMAHAWVSVDGRAVIGRRGLERFVPLAAFA